MHTSIIPQKAALYIRVSTDEQARHGYSLAEQKHDLETFAARKGYAVIGVYADEGISARKLYKNRPALMRLLDDVQAGKINIIIFKCLDRWCRSVKDYYAIQDILDRHKVMWECTQEDYNTTTTAGRLALNIRLAVAQNEADQTSDRIKYVFAGKRARGEALGSCPFGYTVIDKHYAINEQEAAVVRAVFADVLAGGTITTAHKVASRLSDRLLTRREVRNILRRKGYTGCLRGIPDYYPPIISAVDFERAQAITASHVRAPKADTITYLFSGLIACPCCGRTLEARKGYKTRDGTYKYYIYVCGRRYNAGSKEHCDYSTGMSETRVERWLVAHLKEELAAYVATAKKQAHKPKNHAARIKTLSQKLGRLKELYIDNLIDKDTYKRDYDSIQAELSEIAREQATVRQFPRQYREIMQGDNFAQVYGKLSREGKRRFWRAIIARIEFDYVPIRKGHEIPFRITFR